MKWARFILHDISKFKLKTANLNDLPESRGADQNSPIVSVHSGLGRRRSKCHGLADGARTQKQKRRHRHCRRRRHGVEESAHLAAHAGNGIRMNFGLKRKKE